MSPLASAIVLPCSRASSSASSSLSRCDQLEELHHHARAALRVGRGPGRLRGLGVLDGRAHFGLRGQRDLGADVAVHRLEHIGGAARGARDMLAADKMTVMDHAFLPSKCCRSLWLGCSRGKMEFCRYRVQNFVPARDGIARGQIHCALKLIHSASGNARRELDERQRPVRSRSEVRLAVMISVLRRWRRWLTTACRGSIEPAATSGRNGWYVMYGSGSTIVTVASPGRSHFQAFMRCRNRHNRRRQ